MPKKTDEELEQERLAKEEADRKAAETKAAEDAKRGYPSNTAPADMTAEQQAAYWKDRSHENEARFKSRGDYDDLKAKADAFDKWKAEHASDEEKALDEARRNGETAGAQKYLKDAVKGRFQAITRKSDEDVETAFEHVDATSFTDDKGQIDMEKIQKFAATFGDVDDDSKNDNGGDSYSHTIRTSRKPSAKTSGSIAEKRKQYRESHTPTNSKG